jgi:hypothetical protein
MHYGQFHLNLAAGLEDDLIRVIKPEWNGGKKEVTPPTVTGRDQAGEQALPPEQALDGVKQSFTFMLQPTYYRTGFFNVGVAAQALLGSNGDTIELFLPGAPQPLLGKINRTANDNGTPRVMGGTGLRDWFQAAAAVMDPIAVDVLSPTAIRLRGPRDA